MASPALPDIDTTQITRVKPMNFFVDFIIDGAVSRLGMQAMSQECMMAQLTILACANLPRLQGWNLYDERGKLVSSVSSVNFIAEVAERTTLSKNPADKNSAGWRALPTVTPTSEKFKEQIEKAKEEGRIPN